MGEILCIIAESELPTAGIAGPAHKYGIKEARLYRWRAKYKGLSTQEAKRLKVLESENRRLKKLMTEKELILQNLDEILKKSFESGPEAPGDPGYAPARGLAWEKPWGWSRWLGLPFSTAAAHLRGKSS